MNILKITSTHLTIRYGRNNMKHLYFLVKLTVRDHVDTKTEKVKRMTSRSILLEFSSCAKNQSLNL